MLKAAVMEVSELIVKTQFSVPEQGPPDHPAKEVSLPQIGVRVITDPSLKVALHKPAVGPQYIPSGVLYTVPVEFPAPVIVKVC